ncbi:MAG: DNA topoisomerase I [Candidatus Woesearchaeota archaeon]|jgi:DNA topoisomerase-1
MAYQLIITEKPSAAKKIAESLADGKPLKKTDGKVTYWEVTHGKFDLVIAPAVGHLYTLTEKEKKGWTYPVFDVKWVESSEVGKDAAHTKAYVKTLKKLAKPATAFILATDYDIEGDVIGFNILKFACNNKQDIAKRMKYSTLTRDELRDSFDNSEKTINWGQTNAGLTRHELDWYYGINLSRALSLAVKTAGSFKVLSSGRVQGPTLKVVVDREKEITNFKSEPFWQIELRGSIKDTQTHKDAIIEAWHKEDKITDEKRAKEIIQNTKGKSAVIADIQKREFQQAPPTPFDLTTLQTESYRCLKYQPKRTLEIAQELYLAGLISYPRTSSQQLPEALGYKKLITALHANPEYKALAERLLAKSPLKPNNGKKTDPAHPAIYPTGNKANIEGQKQRLYDLIVKRFLATFSEPAVRETNQLIIDVNKEEFIAKGTRTIKKGWHEFYMPYVKLEEQEMPHGEKGNAVKVKEIVKHDLMTQPPKRYTVASIIKELEKQNLGTKATRASIIETLFNRGYVDMQTMSATKLGIQTVETLEKYCPSILDQQLTRHFEEEMVEIQENKKKPVQVLDEAKEVLLKILKIFKSHEKQIGKELIVANREAQEIASTIGPCPQCKHNGTLVIKKGKFGLFIACSAYPDCDKTFKIPMGGMVKPTDKICPICNHPIILVIKKARRPQQLCINVNCPSKHEGVSAKEVEELHVGKIIKHCPKCKAPLILRKSVYGTFLGCSTFPKCRHIERVGEKVKKETVEEKVEVSAEE